MKIVHVLDSENAYYTLSGDLDVYSASKLHEILMNQRESNRLILDMSRVDFIDSTALAVLVQVLKSCREHGGDLCLVALTEPVQTILHLTRLEQIFAIVPDHETAVQHYRVQT